MACPSDLVAAISEIFQCTPFLDEPGSYVVSTSCLYPSGKVVRVLVRPSGDTYTVTDNGWTLYEVRALGIARERPGHTIIPIAHNRGLKYDKGVIYIDGVNASSLSAAIVFVSNVSKQSAEKVISEYEYPHDDKFRIQFGSYIRNTFKDKFSRGKIPGSGGKEYNCDYIYHQGPNKLLITDPIWPHFDSLSRKLVMHRDIAKRKDASVEQYLVMSDGNWTDEDKSLLDLVADYKIPTVPFSLAKNELLNMVAPTSYLNLN